MKKVFLIACVLFITTGIGARTFFQNPVHPNWHSDVHQLKNDTVMLRYGKLNEHTGKVSTEFIAVKGDVIFPYYSEFVGRHTVMAYLGENAEGYHLLLFGWQFHPDFKMPNIHKDEFVILQFTPKAHKKAQHDVETGFNDAVTYFEALLYSPEKLETLELQEIKQDLNINILTCPGDYAILKLGKKMKLESIDKIIVEEAIENYTIPRRRKRP